MATKKRPTSGELLAKARMGVADQAACAEQIDAVVVPLRAELATLRERRKGQGDEVGDEPSVGHRFAVLSEHVERMETSQAAGMDWMRKLEKYSEERLHELERQRAADTQHSEVWRSIGKVTLPLLGGAVIALFGWVWNSHTSLMLLQSQFSSDKLEVNEDVDGLQSQINAAIGQTGDRFTRTQADERHTALNEKIDASVQASAEQMGKNLDHLREDMKGDLATLEKRIEFLDRRLHETERAAIVK